LPKAIGGAKSKAKNRKVKVIILKMKHICTDFEISDHIKNYNSLNQDELRHVGKPMAILGLLKLCFMPKTRLRRMHCAQVLVTAAL
jgi:hypothetical protein